MLGYRGPVSDPVTASKITTPVLLQLLAFMLSFAAVLLWRRSWPEATSPPLQQPFMYPPSPQNRVFADFPAPFTVAMLGLLSVEEMFSDGSRRTLSLADVTSIYKSGNAGGGGPSPPIAFVINLDRRTDRLNRTIQDWAVPRRVRLLRVSARPTTGNLNGDTLTHLSLIFAMEEWGWPYIVVLEDDAIPRQPQWDDLFLRILAFVSHRRGDVAWVNFCPSFVENVGREVDGLLFSVEKMQTTLAGIYGRRMIPAAHALLPRLLNQPTANRDDAAVDFAFGRTRVGLPQGNDLCISVESA